jgi:hypothetical protein
MLVIIRTNPTGTRKPQEIRVWNSLLRFGKAGSGTRIATLKGIDNTYPSA